MWCTVAIALCIHVCIHIYIEFYVIRSRSTALPASGMETDHSFSDASRESYRCEATCSATFSRDSDWLDMLLVHVSQIIASGSTKFPQGEGLEFWGFFFFFFLSQPLIMSDVNSVILSEIDNDV